MIFIYCDFSSDSLNYFSFRALIDPENTLNIVDILSQINTLQQVENITSHGFLKDLIAKNQIHLHALWLDITNADIYLFSKKHERFIIIDEKTVNDLLKEVMDD